MKRTFLFILVFLTAVFAVSAGPKDQKKVKADFFYGEWNESLPDQGGGDVWMETEDGEEEFSGWDSYSSVPPVWLFHEDGTIAVLVMGGADSGTWGWNREKGILTVDFDYSEPSDYKVLFVSAENIELVDSKTGTVTVLYRPESLFE